MTPLINKIFMTAKYLTHLAASLFMLFYGLMFLFVVVWLILTMLGIVDGKLEP